MSIYSGFATRSLQQYYDKILYNLISTLLLRLSKFYNNQPVEQSVFFKIVQEHESTLRKLEKRKYLDPKYSKLLTIFKKQINGEDPEEQLIEAKQYKDHSRHKDHQFNRTLSLLGRQFGELKAHAEKEHHHNHREETLEQKDSVPNLMKIEERKKHVSKKKRKEKKASIKSNLDIFDARQMKPPELPSLHPLNQLNRTIMSKTKFNNFSEKIRSKQIEEHSFELDQQAQSLKNILAKPPKFRAKMYYK